MKKVILCIVSVIIVIAIGAQVINSRISGALIFYSNGTSYNTVKGGNRIEWTAANCTYTPIEIEVSVNGDGTSKSKTYRLSSPLNLGKGSLSVENTPSPINYYIQGEVSGYPNYSEDMIAFVQYVYENQDN